MKKEKYIAPILETFTYRVEKGFAGSPQIIMDVSDRNENVTEGTNYNIYGEDTWY